MPDGTNSLKSLSVITSLIPAIDNASVNINANNSASCLVIRFKLPMWPKIDWTVSNNSLTFFVSKEILSSFLMNFVTKSSMPNVPTSLTISATWPRSALNSSLVKSSKNDTL